MNASHNGHGIHHPSEDDPVARHPALHAGAIVLFVAVFAMLFYGLVQTAS